MEVSVEVADKAVSTTDDQNDQHTITVQQSFESGDSSGINIISSNNTTEEADAVQIINPTNQYFQMARLEAVLTTLLENKFIAIRKSIQAKKAAKALSPRKRVANKLQRILSSSTASSSPAGKAGDINYDSDLPINRKDWKHEHRSRNKRKKYTDSDNEYEASPNHRRHKRRRRGRASHRISSRSPVDKYPSPQSHWNERILDIEHYDDDSLDIIHHQHLHHSPLVVGQQTLSQLPQEMALCTCNAPIPMDQSIDDDRIPTCCLLESGRSNNQAQLKIHYDEDYLSINVENFHSIENEQMMPHDLSPSRHRSKHQRPRRKKRRRKHHHKHHPTRHHKHHMLAERVKSIDPDDLPQRARWTIVATACLLLLMCLLLIGVTLRMAPVIDEMGKST